MTLNNCVFFRATGRSIQSNASIINSKKCIFSDTITTGTGPLGTLSHLDNTTSTYENCEFRDSYKYYGGTLAYNENSKMRFLGCYIHFPRNEEAIGSLVSNNSEVEVSNCLFFTKHNSQNNANYSAYTLFEAEGQSHFLIRNTTVIGHTTSIFPVVSCGTGSTLKVINSIFWRNGSLIQSAPLYNDIITSDNNNPLICNIQNSILFKQTETQMQRSIEGINPRLVDITNPQGPDNILFTSDDGLIPCSCSPAVNAGDNGHTPNVNDIAGSLRIQNGTIDIGAYESVSTPTLNNVFFVKEGNTGGNGQSWAGAYGSLQQALENKCADTIKVAQGIYKPARTSRDSSFRLNTNITLLGGYPAVGSPADNQRNPDLYPTILSGDIGIPGDSLDNTYTVIKINCPDTTVILDGFVVENGNHNTSLSNGGGIGIIATQNAIIKNCIIRNNYATFGGGLYATKSCIKLEKTKILNNRSFAESGGFFLIDLTSTVNNITGNLLADFNNCIIAGNSGGGGKIDGSYPSGTNGQEIQFTNTVFYKNEAQSVAGLRIVGEDRVNIINCAFIRNNVTTNSGTGIGVTYINSYSQSVMPVYVYNTLFKDNTLAGQPSTTINTDFNWSNGPNHWETIPPANLQYSSISNSQTGYGIHLLPSHLVTLPDIDNGPGPDNLWMTADDGVRPTICSGSIDHGSNDLLYGLASDILDSTRIKNLTTDIGPYETNGFSTRISASDSLICPGETVTISSQVINPGNNPVYIWTVNGVPSGTNNPVFTSSTLLNNDIVQLKVKTVDCVSGDTAYSNKITMRVGTSLTPLVSVTASDTSLCAGSPVSFTANVTRANPGTIYQWKVNGTISGTNSPLFTTSNLTGNNQITVDVIVNATCLNTQIAISDPIDVTIKPILTPQISISSSTNPSCNGSSVTFSSLIQHGGTVPVIQWNINGNHVGTNSPTFTSAALSNNDIVSATLLSSETCLSQSHAVSNSITQQTNPHIVPSVTISSNPITCPGQLIQFLATPVNAGSQPSYSWLKNGQITGVTTNSYSSSELLQGDMISVRMSGNSSCINATPATSNLITVNYTNAVIPSVTITASVTTICSGNNVTFTASPLNGGANPTFEWYINNTATGITGATYTTGSLSNNNQVKAVMHSSLPCITNPQVNSNTITINVNNTSTPAVTIHTNQTTICSGTTTLFTSSIVNGGNAPHYQWQINGTNTGTNSNTFSTSTLANNDQVKLLMTSNANCALPTQVSSNIIIMSITPVVIPAITISGTTTLPNGQSSTLAATSTNGGTTPQYQWGDSTSTHGWQIISGANAATLNYTPQTTGDKVRCALQSNAACATPNPVISNALQFTITPVTAINPVPASRMGIRSYPNPVNDILYLDSLKISDRWNELEILSASGAALRFPVVVSGRTSLILNVSSLPSGAYMLRLKRKTGPDAIIRFIKQ